MNNQLLTELFEVRGEHDGVYVDFPVATVNAFTDESVPELSNEFVANMWSDEARAVALAAKQATRAANSATLKATRMKALGFTGEKTDAKAAELHKAAASAYDKALDQHFASAKAAGKLGTPEESKGYGKLASTKELHEKMATFHGGATANVYMSAEEMAWNQFCATGEGGGVDPSCGKDQGHADPAHALEHTGHELHTAHEVHEVAEALGGGYNAMHAAAGHAADAASHAHDAAHGHPDEIAGIAIRHAASDAVKVAAAGIAAVPGGKKVAEGITALHDGATKVADAAVAKLQERYGHATAAAILGAGAAVSAGVRAAVGLSGPLGAAIPGQKFIGAIPMVALAEAGKRLGLVGHDSALERHVATAAKWVHAVREAIGRPVKAIGSELWSTAERAAHPAGKLAAKAVDWAVNEHVDIDKAAEELVAQMYEWYAEKVKASGVIHNAQPRDERGRFAASVNEHFGHLFGGHGADRRAFVWKVDHEDKILHIQPVQADGDSIDAVKAEQNNVKMTQAAADKFEKANEGWNVVVRDPRATHNSWSDAARAASIAARQAGGQDLVKQSEEVKTAGKHVAGALFNEEEELAENADQPRTSDGRFATSDSTAEHLKSLSAKAYEGKSAKDVIADFPHAAVAETQAALHTLPVDHLQEAASKFGVKYPEKSRPKIVKQIVDKLTATYRSAKANEV